MAIILDEERQEDENVEYASLEADTEQEQEAPANLEPEQEDEIPEKYRGKSPAEIAKMHQEAEKLLGRQSSEVGELRKIVDDFVKAQLETKTAPAQTEDDEPADWYLNPEKAVQQAISNHPTLKQAEEAASQMKQQQAVAALQSKHPDYQEILGDQAFADWISQSKIRLQLFKQADQQYDTDAADELLTTWKERKGRTDQVVANERNERKEKVKSASTGSVAGSGEAPSRKIYRRSDIIELMRTNPDRYMQMADEIAKAYAEKRVK